jgi:WD40 repeat protein/transcriptional regulator with XRE-family HTH domain
VPQGVPDPSTITTRQDFAQALTALREQAGLTVREVARAAGLQPSTVGGYFGGRHLPPIGSTPGVLADLLTACGVTEPQEQQAWRDTLLLVRRTPAQRASSSPAPYRGLASFQPEDAEWFFGREELVEGLVSRVAAAGRRLAIGTGRGLVVVVGASGSGKSSLLRAGLIPALERGAVDGEPWSWMLLTPGDDPLAELDRLEAGDTAPDGDLAIVVDQFEELFTACADEEQRRTFVTRLLGLAGRRTGRTVVVAGLRADFYGHATRLPGLVSALQDAQLVVGPMTTSQLRRAITEPARRAQVSLEEGLVELLLGALAPGTGTQVAAHDPGALPLLSHALLATWQRGQQTTLRISDYLAVGGIDGAVAGTADAVFEALTPQQQDTARRLFRRLVSVAEGAADTRRRVSFAELGPQADDVSGPLRTVLDAFVGHRLLTADADGVEISHEALLNAWPRLRSWVDADRAGLSVHRGITDIALTWDAADRDPQLLLQGGRLATAQEWAAEPDRADELSPLERAFLAAAAERQQAQRLAELRSTRRLRWLAASLVVLVLLTGGLAGYALHLQSTAANDRDLAASRQVAGEAQRLRGTDVAMAGQLSVLAYRTSGTSQARSAVLDSAAMPLATRLTGPPGVLQSVSTGSAAGGSDLVAAAGEKGVVRLWTVPAPGHGGATRLADLTAGDGGATLFATALAPNRRVLAAAGGDHKVYLWDVSTPGKPAPIGTALTGPQNTVYALAFSPDGSVLAAGSADGTVRLWSLTDPGHPQELATIADSGGYVQAVAFSPDGSLLAAAGVDRTARLWDVRQPTQPKPWRGPMPYRGGSGVQVTGAASTIFGMTFSPDGHTLAGSTKDGTVLLWRLDQLSRAALTASPAVTPTLAPWSTLTGPGNWVNGVAFSPDGTQLAAASSDGKVWIWDAAAGRLRAQLPHPAPVTAVSWHGADALFTSCADGDVRRWSLPAPTLGMTGSVYSVSFSRDGRRLSAATTGEAMMWDVGDPARPTPAGPGVTGAVSTTAGPLDGASALSPDGTLLAAGTKQGAVAFWDVTDPAHPRQLGEPVSVGSQVVEWLEFSPDGRTVVAGTDDATVRLVDVRDREHPVVAGPPLTGPGNLVMGVTFSRDGRTVAAATANRTIWLWDVSDVQAPKALGEPLRGPASYVYSVAFSPDGRTLAAGTADHSVWLWDVADRAHPHPLGVPLTGPSNYVYTVAFSPDGRLLAAGAGDHTVWLWDVADRTAPQVRATLTDAGGAVYAVAFSPDGATLAAGSGDKTVWLWPVDPDRAIGRLCVSAGDPLTLQEWQLSAPGLSRRSLC